MLDMQSVLFIIHGLLVEKIIIIAGCNVSGIYNSWHGGHVQLCRVGGNN